MSRFRSRCRVLVRSLVVGLCAVALLHVWNRKPPAEPIRPSVWTGAFDASGWQVHLAADPDLPSDRRVDPESAVREALGAFLQDEYPLDLIRRFYGAIPVEIGIVGPSEWEKTREVPPRTPSAIALRAALNKMTSFPADGVQVPHAVLGFARVTRLRTLPLVLQTGSPQQGAGAAPPDAWKEPTGADLLFLALEDYSLRRRNGWFIFGGPVIAGGPLPAGVAPGSPEHRADLDRRIERRADECAEFYRRLNVVP